jgi:hypothetical protein
MGGPAPRFASERATATVSGSLYSFSCLLLRLKGLWFWKKPLFLFCTCLSAGMLCGGATAEGAGCCCFVGDCFPLGGSKLDMDVGLEYSLCESRLRGRDGLAAELRSDVDGGAVRQYMVMPSLGYSLCGTVGSWSNSGG